MELVVGVSTNGSRVLHDRGIDNMGILRDASVSQDGLYAEDKGSGTAECISGVKPNARPTSSEPRTPLTLLLTIALEREVPTEQLYELMYSEMSVTLLGWCQNRMKTTHRAINGLQAEDLSQRVWLQVWRFLPSFDYTRSDRGSPGGRLVAWVYLIAANAHTDWYRHDVLIKQIPLKVEVDSYRPVLYKSTTVHERRDERKYRATFTDQERNPEEQVLSEQYAIYVEAECRKALTKQQYTVLRLRANGLSYDEIAEVLSTTMTAVKATLYRARITAGKAIGINVMTE